ncbi:hypothetical protein TWF506_006040 [Arthrobotrys conoides]|uniref:Uncharacterized protein n=1 Tax=Arthrobotrys conoides TaxID=74498 RepID=A0AAN8N8A7_9PEZI
MRMLLAVVRRRPTPAISALIKLATKTASPQKRYAGDYSNIKPREPFRIARPVKEGPVTLYDFEPVDPIDPPHHIVKISVWDVIKRCWIPCETEGIQLKMGHRRLLLERDLEYNDQLVPVASLEWRLKEGEVLPAFVENIYEYDPSYLHFTGELPSPLHPIFYFGLNRSGQPSTLRKGPFSKDNNPVTRAALDSLVAVRNKIKEVFSWVLHTDAVWIRLEPTEPAEKSRATDVLMRKSEKRLQVLTEWALPCRGRPPFLQGNGRFEPLDTRRSYKRQEGEIFYSTRE